MIKRLNIVNYALIDRIDIDLESGFIVITGETGAGKSIILGAIGLTLGDRIDSSVVGKYGEKCIIEITYDVSGYHSEEWFAKNDLDYTSDVIVRREMTAGGRSRAFINDTPVSVKLLKELGGELVDIHSQYQSLLIGNPEYQLEVLDAACNNGEILEHYKSRYAERERLKHELREIEQKANEANREEDYLKFQFNQLDAANLTLGEQEELEQELALLNNAEQIQGVLAATANLLTGSENPVVQGLRGVRNQIMSLNKVLQESEGYGERLQSVILELEDIADEAERRAALIEYSPTRIQAINERLSTLYDLLLKHKKERVEELIILRDELLSKIRRSESFEEEIDEKRREIIALEKAMQQLATQLHQRREEGREVLESEMGSLLQDLGMKHPCLVVKIEEQEEFLPSGIDNVTFMFSANKNQEPGELAKVASGGELSRLMLSFKYILSRIKQLPAIIFDEIDTGISGEIAYRMALMLRKMSNSMQVINITHLPQIAAMGDLHLKVYKKEEEETVTNIKRLDNDERVMEIAGMISGSAISKEALENAKHLLNG